MYFKALHWTIADLNKRLPTIDPKPQYQRGDVWDKPRKQLLIDTVFNGFDIPKLYLRHIGAEYRYEVADGQQRIAALTEYRNGAFSTSKINGPMSHLSNCKYEDLPQKAKLTFDSHVLSISVAYQASNDEIREVFRRLQLGVRLTPPELRNSLPSVIGDSIRGMATNHPYFRACSFSGKRFRYDDLAAHAFLVALQGPNTDVKAPNIKEIYENYSDTTPEGLEKKVNRALKYLNEMQREISGLITRKWGFVDLVNWYFHCPYKHPSAAVAAHRYSELENLRLSNASKPELLLEDESADSQRLYDYIIAFRFEASTKKHVNQRYLIVSEYLASGTQK